MSKFDQRNQKVDTQLNADKINVGLKPVTCPKCKNGNPATAKYCGECGASLFVKCSICKEETSVGSKFCSGCGIEIGKADEKIKLAEKMRGSSTRELSYSFTGFIRDKLNPFSYLMADKHTMRFTLDIDEYEIKHEDTVLLYKGDRSSPDWTGRLHLTNKRLIFFAVEPVDRINYDVILYPLSDLKDVKFDSSKALFGSNRILSFIWDGKFRKIQGISDTFNEEWMKVIKQHS